jgi:hemin uptake protein HemP
MKNPPATDQTPSVPPREAAPAPRVVRVESRALLAGGREAIIVHQGEEYRLRVTRQDKLILTK